VRESLKTTGPRRKYQPNAERQAANRRRKKQPVYFSSQSINWETPQALFDELDEEFSFTLDVCADETNHKVDLFFTREQDGLKQSWLGHRCWMNPPYGSQIKLWIQKAYESVRSGTPLVVCLVPARVDTGWFHRFIHPYAEIRYPRGRLKFGAAKHSAPFPSAIVVFRSAHCAGCACEKGVPYGRSSYKQNEVEKN